MKNKIQNNLSITLSVFILISCTNSGNKIPPMTLKDTTNTVLNKENKFGISSYYDSTTNVTITKENEHYISTYYDSISNVTVIRKYDSTFSIQGIYTVVNKNKYFIDSISNNGTGLLPEPIIDPTGKYLFYGTGSGCGFENEGVTIIRADVSGKRKDLVIKSCNKIELKGTLDYNGMLYLLVQIPENHSEEGASFSLFDVQSLKKIVKIEGLLTETEKNIFSYSPYDRHSDQYKPIGTVTVKQLINGEKPLRKVR